MKTEYIRQQTQPVPAPPVYYPVTFVKKDDSYCTSDEKSAKNLLKNRELDKGYQGEMRGSLEDMNKGEGR